MSSDPPKPQVFAIMRNGHEVIRGAMVDIKDAIEKKDIETAKGIWEKLHKWEGLHKTMEEGNDSGDSPIGFFKILDEKVDGLATENKLFDNHVELDALEAKVTKACADSKLDDLSAAFTEFADANEKHLKTEEDVMMPAIKKLMMAGEPLKKYMTEEILATIVNSNDDFEFFVKFANEILEKHHGGMPRARVFDHALWAVATPDQWGVWSGWMKETLAESTYAELEKVIP